MERERLTNFSINDLLDRALKNQRALLRLSRLALEDPERAMESILVESASCLEVDRVSLWTLSADGEGIQCRSLFLAREMRMERPDLLVRFAAFPQYAAAVSETRRVIDASDAWNDPRTLEFRESYLRPYNVAAMLDSPIVFNKRLYGVLCIEQCGRTRSWTRQEIDFASFAAQIIATALEASDRQLVEANLRRTEEQYRSIYENAIEGLFQSGLDGTILSANPAMARLLGYHSPTELIERGRIDYIEPNRLEELIGLFQHSNIITDFESQVRTAKGEIVWITESVRGVRDDQGALIRFEGIAMDITLRVETANALKEAKESADAANLAKSQFLANVSHELRTPLNGILGFTQILSKEGGMSERQTRGIQVIHQSAEHLLALINDILDLSKIEANRIELQPDTFDATEFFHAIEALFLPRAREKGIVYRQVIDPALPAALVGDERKLRQVMINIVGNAVKFTTKGEVMLEVRREGNRTSFRISDTGPGIPTAHLPHLFEPFYQVRQSGRHLEGTGLGLAISQNVVKLMGGEIAVESRPGVGTAFTFDISLPASEHPLSGPNRAPVLGYRGEQKRILVVDDVPENRRILVELLEPLGFVTAEAENGQEAIDSVGAEMPDLILMDLRMPVMSGIEAARHLRAGRDGLALPIVAVSASAFDLDQKACLEAGCNAFLTKPVRLESLLEVLEHHLRLEWIHASSPAPSPEPVPEPLLEIPAKAGEEIQHWALRGNFARVRDCALALKNREPRYAPFADRVLELASQFKMKAIRQLVHTPTPSEPDETLACHGSDR